MTREQLSQLSQEELVRLIEECLDASTPQESCMDQVQPILDELDSREEQAPVFDAEKGWEDLQEQHPAFFGERKAKTGSVTPKRRRKFRLSFILAAVLAVILGTTVIAQAAGIDVFGAIARWTQDSFYFERSAAPAEPVAACAPLYETLQTNHITEQVAPTWIPENMEQTNLVVDSNIVSSLYQATYIDEENNGFTISIFYFVDPSKSVSLYEKDDGEVTVYTSGNINHYFMTNLNTTTIAWINGHCECSISTNLPDEVMEEIIDSIYA